MERGVVVIHYYTCLYIGIFYAWLLVVVGVTTWFAWNIHIIIRIIAQIDAEIPLF